MTYTLAQQYDDGERDYDFLNAYVVKMREELDAITDQRDAWADVHRLDVAELAALKAAPNYAAQATVECAEYTIDGLLAELAALKARRCETCHYGDDHMLARCRECRFGDMWIALEKRVQQAETELAVADDRYKAMVKNVAGYEATIEAMRGQYTDLMAQLAACDATPSHVLRLEAFHRAVMHHWTCAPDDPRRYRHVLRALLDAIEDAHDEVES